jgi:TRAP-type C4-dicarboxylate transport system permease small subunit
MKKLLHWWESLLTCAAVVATAIMVLLTSTDAIGRYLFNRPITGAYEVTEKYLMLSSVFLGCAYSYRKGAFIRVTILTNHIRRAVLLVINHLVQLFSILYIIVLTFATILQVVRAYTSHMTFNSIAQPVWPSCAIIPVGLFLMLILMVLDLRRIRSGGSALFKEDSPTV